MRERPIIFNAEMVRAILNGRKTQTRRPVRPQPTPQPDGRWMFTVCSTDRKERNTFCYTWPDPDGNSYTIRGRESSVMVRPPCLVGHRLWVRETWAWYGCERMQDEVLYRSDGVDLPAEFGRWRPSIHMPRWASRLVLEVTGVRVERLQSISHADARAEGMESKRHFIQCWTSIYDADAWSQNPWVWVIDFRRVEA